MNITRTNLAVCFSCALLIGFASCKKDHNNDEDTQTLNKEILADVSANVCKDSYEDMYTKAQSLMDAVTALNTSTTDANLQACRTQWRNMRTTWEQSEGWLFGPIEANNIDPRIDTWPVDFNALEAVLQSDDDLTEEYVNNLDESLKGFHPIEYLLWGSDGNKSAAAITAREKEYLVSLTQNLVKLSKEVRDTWSNGYDKELANAGNGSTEFPTIQSAFIQINDAMADICGEVGESKMKEPFDAQNPSLEESPFSQNSLTDFTNNIKGVMDMYQGRFIKDGKGIEDLVRQHNLSLDAEIKSKYEAAIAALADIDKPFGQAIISEQSKVGNAMTKVGDLHDVLDEKLKPFLQQYAN